MPQGKQRSGRLIIPNVRQGEEDPIDPSSFGNSNRFDCEQTQKKKHEANRHSLCPRHRRRLLQRQRLCSLAAGRGVIVAHQKW